MFIYICQYIAGLNIHNCLDTLCACIMHIIYLKRQKRMKRLMPKVSEALMSARNMHPLLPRRQGSGKRKIDLFLRRAGCVAWKCKGSFL